MIKKQFTDSNGLQRIALVKSEWDNPEKGIPNDNYELLREFYTDASSDFIKTLYQKLWDVGIREIQDLADPANKRKVREAINRSQACDATDLQRYVTQVVESQNDTANIRPDENRATS